MKKSMVGFAAAGLLLALGRTMPIHADEPAAAPKKDPTGMTRLHPTMAVWLDVPNKRVVMVGEVCLREGQLEMFACVRRTKEHESILTVPTAIAEFGDPN